MSWERTSPQVRGTVDFVFICHDSAVFEQAHTTLAAPDVLLAHFLKPHSHFIFTFIRCITQ